MDLSSAAMRECAVPMNELPLGSPHPLKLLLHNLCRAVVNDQLEPQKLTKLLANEGELPEALRPLLASHLADVFWFMGLELEADNSSLDVKQYHALIQVACNRQAVEEDVLRARLESDVLQEVGIVKDAADFHKRQVKMNTRMLYTQQKYNLFREESEGYSKLIAELSELPAAAGDHTSTRGCKNATEVIQNLQSLIGYFDLDPNRVLDLVLEALEAVPSRVANRALVSLFNPSFIPHMIGFKFSLYTKPGATTTPDSLYTMCGLLLSQGSVSLEQVLPHLSPPLEALLEAESKRTAELLARAKKAGAVSLGGAGVGSGIRKSLADFGSLDDGGGSAAATDKTLTDKASADKAAEDLERPDLLTAERMQPLGLLRALLQLREWKVAKRLMEVLDGVDVAAYDMVREALCGLLDWLTAAAYVPISPRKTFLLLDATAVSSSAAPVTSAARRGASELNPEVVISVHSAEAEPADSLDVHLAQATTPASAVFAAVPLLQRIGCHLHSAPLLMARLCRLCTAALAAMPTDAKLAEAVDACVESSILPALTLSVPNPGLVHELWKLLEAQPYTTRYRLYGVLHEKMKGESSPELAVARARTADETKRMMRRLSKENTKMHGRHLGKITHNVPSVVFDTILGQIQAYDNLIVPVVDMMKYLTAMSFDVLTYIILSHLASPTKERLKDDGLSVSLWMQSLSSFCGNLYKKYPTIELQGLLEYIANTLKSGQSLQLLLMRDLIVKMAGIELLEDVSRDQLEAQAGGETLKLSVTDVLGIAKNTRRSSTRLKDALVKNRLVVPLFLLIAQQRGSVVFANDTPHLKVLSELYDRCHETLEQYAAFLASTISPADYAAMVPPVGTLCSEYNLEPEVAFFICRPAIAELDSQQQLTATEGPAGKKGSPAKEGALDSHAICAVLPTATWNVLSPRLYATFWSLSLYDIFVPKQRYEAETRRLKKHVEETDRWVPPIGGEQGDPKLNQQKRKREKERALTSIDKLKMEQSTQQARHREIVMRLSRSKDDWFASPDTAMTGAADGMNSFLQYCIFPRCVFSPADAVYCARFVQQTHAQGTPYFSTLQYYDKLLRDVSVHIFCCTERQAANLGRFLKESLSLLLHWKSDEVIYREECSKRPGFSVSFNKVDQRKASYPDFVKVVFKWYCKVSKSILACLESTEYMEVRNALHVLTKIIDVFPIMSKLAEMIEKRVDKLRKDDSKKDLQIQSSQYYTMLQKLKPALEKQDQFCRGIPIEGGAKGAKVDDIKEEGSKASVPVATDTEGNESTAVDKDQTMREADAVEAQPQVEADRKRATPSSANGGRADDGPPPKAVRHSGGAPPKGADASTAHDALNPNAKPFVPPSTKALNSGGATTTSVESSDRRGGGGNMPSAGGDRKREREADAKRDGSAEPKDGLGSPGPPPKMPRDDKRGCGTTSDDKDDDAGSRRDQFKSEREGTGEKRAEKRGKDDRPAPPPTPKDERGDRRGGGGRDSTGAADRELEREKALREQVMASSRQGERRGAGTSARVGGVGRDGGGARDRGGDRSGNDRGGGPRGSDRGGPAEDRRGARGSVSDRLGERKSDEKKRR